MTCNKCGKFIGSSPHVVSIQHLPGPGTEFRARLCVECADKLTDDLTDLAKIFMAMAPVGPH